MSEENEEAICKIIDRKLNIHQYKKVMYDAGILSSTKLFSTPISVLSFSTSVPIDVFQQVLEVVAENTIPQVDLVESKELRGRFHDQILDRFLIIPESGIVELCGQASAGKSNIAYHMAVQERIYDISRRVVLISTEGKIPTQRISQIASYAENSPYDAGEIMGGILLSEADSVAQLNEYVQNNLPPLFYDQHSPPPSLVIIDSIAALFRIEYDMSATSDRTRILFDITSTLKWISTTYNTLVVITNQATANLSAFATNSNDWIPSLGFSWSNCINVRMRVTKTQMKHQVVIERSSAETIRTTPRGEKEERSFPTVVPIRTIYVEISPIKQDIRAELYIDHSGVHGI